MVDVNNRLKGFDKAQRAYDAQTPDEPDDVECPECDALMSELSDGTWSCDECGFQMTSEYFFDEEDL